MKEFELWIRLCFNKNKNMISKKQILDAKILIVDDETDNVSVLERILKIEGYTNLQSTTDSRDVKTIYQDFLPDLVLLDLGMPHMDGFEVMGLLKEINKGTHLPILVLTALQDDDILLKALDSGAQDFINKPFDLPEVLARIRNMLEVRLLQKELKKQNEVLEKKVCERTKELNETRLEIIRRLTMAAEYRDNETGQHIIRMSKMCALLGKTIGMNESQYDLLLNASPMHDIGKIGIPDRVLLKPGKLDPEEWEIMKTHTIIGAELLSGHSSELMEMARIIALTHHEKWNGTGYPEGLKGEEIPLVGRICAVCDVFDALTSDRPYKKAWSIEDSLSEIYKNSGKDFDPKLVEAFKKVKDDIIKIIEDRTDTKGIITNKAYSLAS